MYQGVGFVRVVYAFRLWATREKKVETNIVAWTKTDDQQTSSIS